MTFIAEGGGRTVTNCMVHDKRKVYELVTLRVVDDLLEEVAYHVIATSAELAGALYQERWGRHGRHSLKAVKVLFVIDEEIHMRPN